ncbi:hypothetical protein [Corallococcus exercitus]|uniref:KAP NTPase domain-containing protein n=1 Tax=Corallococcus exercitus TaxID=2316736 RepID=A0A7Y4KF42_9BACT|nr:hypothetical protein [Corallococcus exercitus]NOK32635.1 hypothetical protein [Corallococcus exercitus]
MSINDDVKKTLVRLLSAKREGGPGSVSLITGPWGAGKTHFWKKEVVPALGRRTSYVSVFGIESSNQLKSRLFTRLVMDGGNWLEGRIGAVKQAEKAVGFISRLTGRTSTTVAGLGEASVSYALSKIPLDPLEMMDLVPRDTVFCVDDVERVSSKYKIEELLGIVNVLSEHKGFDVVLICNEEHMSSSERLGAYKVYKEKVVSTQHLIVPDVEVILDGMIARLDGDVRAKVEVHRKVVLDVLSRSGSSNMRNARRVLDHLAVVYGLGLPALPDAAVEILVALVVELAEGLDREPDFYSFDATYVRFSDALSGVHGGGRREISDLEKARRAFLERFKFGSGFVFSAALFRLVRHGAADAALIKAELFPVVKVETRLGQLIAEVSGERWTSGTAEQVLELARNLVEAAKDRESGGAGRVLKAIQYAVMLSDFAGGEVSDQDVATVKRQVLFLAQNGDDSISDNYELLSGNRDPRISDILIDYRMELRKQLVLEAFTHCKMLIQAGSSVKVADEFRRNGEMARYFVEGGGMEFILPRLASDAAMVSSVAVALGRVFEVWSSAWPDAKKHLNQLVEGLERAQQESGIDRMQAWRIGRALDSIRRER